MVIILKRMKNIHSSIDTITFRNPHTFEFSKVKIIVRLLRQILVNLEDEN